MTDAKASRTIISRETTQNGPRTHTRCINPWARAGVPLVLRQSIAVPSGSRASLRIPPSARLDSLSVVSVSRFHPGTNRGECNPSPRIRSRIASNRKRGTSTSAGWNVTYRACWTTFAPIFMSWSRGAANARHSGCRAPGSVAHRRRGPYRPLPRISRLATIGPIVAGITGGRMLRSPAVGGTLALGGLIVGPSAGQWYAGQSSRGWASVGVRGFGVILAAIVHSPRARRRTAFRSQRTWMPRRLAKPSAPSLTPV